MRVAGHRAWQKLQDNHVPSLRTVSGLWGKCSTGQGLQELQGRSGQKGGTSGRAPTHSAPHRPGHAGVGTPFCNRESGEPLLTQCQGQAEGPRHRRLQRKQKWSVFQSPPAPKSVSSDTLHSLGITSCPTCSRSWVYSYGEGLPDLSPSQSKETGNLHSWGTVRREVQALENPGSQGRLPGGGSLKGQSQPG